MSPSMRRMQSLKQPSGAPPSGSGPCTAAHPSNNALTPSQSDPGTKWHKTVG